MKQKEFEKLVEGGIAMIPEELKKQIDNVRFVVETRPSEEQVKTLNLEPGNLLFGLYQGIPKSRRGEGYTFVLPDQIIIFQEPIESVAKSDEEIKKLVKNTVSHEVAHHFGLNEEQVRAIEIKRRNNN